MNSIRTVLYLLTSAIIITSCENSTVDQTDKIAASEIKRPAPPKKTAPTKIGYHFARPKQLFKSKDSINAQASHSIQSVNRMDLDNLMRHDSILVPDDLEADVSFYMNFPQKVKALEDSSKIIFFSYTTQTFGAYEYGNLVYAGATNMGRKKDPTPTGLYYTNWKAEETKSTFNDEWELKWNFNIQNTEGIGWHEYAMPGYPASHSCLRLLEKDARFLYDWADEWKIKGTDNITKKGTPVIVFGSYDFDGPKPWLKLIEDPKALDISEKELVNQLTSAKLVK